MLNVQQRGSEIFSMSQFIFSLKSAAISVDPIYAPRRMRWEKKERIKPIRQYSAEGVYGY